MRILLINIQNSGSRPGYRGLYIPFGLAYISAVLKKNGYAVDVIDLHNEEVLNGGHLDYLGRLMSQGISKYDVVGFGGTFLKFKILKSLSEKICEVDKNIFQIAGGHMATLSADIILKETKVNCVCLYEGEETIVELLAKIKDAALWEGVKGIKYLDHSRGEIIETPPREKITDLDNIPFPDREIWSFDIIRKCFPYGSPGRYSAAMLASRGCPFQCIFCNSTSGRRLRLRSAENIVSEMKYLKERWNIGFIRFLDEVFIGAKDKIKELCDLMIEEKLDLFWTCQTQLKLVDEDLLKVMKKAGCIEITYGVESGSNRILAEMKKGITRELSREIIELTNRVGIRPSLNLLAGTPSENLETLQETRDFILSLNYINWIEIPRIDFVVPLPHTELYNLAKEGGFINDEKKYVTEGLLELAKHSKTINLTQMTDREFVESVALCNKEIINNFYEKHSYRKILSFFGFDYLRVDLILKNFSFRQLKPISEAFAWATLGKRNNYFNKFTNRFIYG